MGMQKNQSLLVMVIGLMPLHAVASEGDSKPLSAITSFVRHVGTFIDSMAVKGVDRNYIDAPKEPWQVILRGNVNQTDLKMKSTFNGAMFYGVEGDVNWESRIKTIPSAYAGLWAGYRGYGIGYSWNVGGDKGTILTFGATGGSYGVNLRIHHFENDNPEVHYAGRFLDEETGTYQNEAHTEDGVLWNPVRTRTLILDGYYLFNGKRFSYAAAYDQSVIQKRSAGSLMAGAMYYHGHTRYDTKEDADFILLMNDIGRIKQWQVSVGVGYAYNWVPVKGLLVSAMAMPMLTFYNHLKVWRYGSNYRDMALVNEWHEDDELPFTEYEIWPIGETSQNSHMTLNFDARLSLTYQWSRFFVNAYGQFNNFRYGHDNNSGRLNDWFINAAIGVRL